MELHSSTLFYTGNSHWWIPSASAVADSWIQVDLGLPGPVVTGLIVQSHPTQYMETFSVQYSLTGESESWHDLENADGDTIQVSLFFSLALSGALTGKGRKSTDSEEPGKFTCLFDTDISQFAL